MYNFEKKEQFKQEDFTDQENNLGGSEVVVFLKSLEGLAQEAVENIKSIEMIAGSAMAQNEFLQTHIDTLPESEKANFQEKIQALREKTAQTASSFKEAVAMYTKLIILSGMTIFSPNYDTVEGAKQTSLVEQIKKQESFSEMVARAKKELVENGITDEQRGAYKENISDFLQKGIMPFGEYEDVFTVLVRAAEVIPNIVLGKEKTLQFYVHQQGTQEEKDELTQFYRQSEDAWRLYLGVRQENNTFGISEYKPVKSVENKYYFKINDFFGKSTEEVKENIQKMRWRDSVSVFSFGVLREYMMYNGVDSHGSYISYYDKWDFDNTFEGADGFLGKPFEIYDRLYYNPETFEPIYDTQ
jgi:hypothetical protein